MKPVRVAASSVVSKNAYTRVQIPVLKRLTTKLRSRAHDDRPTRFLLIAGTLSLCGGVITITGGHTALDRAANRRARSEPDLVVVGNSTTFPFSEGGGGAATGGGSSPAPINSFVASNPAAGSDAIGGGLRGFNTRTSLEATNATFSNWGTTCPSFETHLAIGPLRCRSLSDVEGGLDGPLATLAVRVPASRGVAEKSAGGGRTLSAMSSVVRSWT